MYFAHDRFRGCRSALAGLLTAACLGLAALAAGPDAYDPAVAYKAGATVVGSDRNTYRAVADVKGSDPATSSHEAWRLAYVASELIIDVPGRFKTIADAWKFLEGCRIAEGAKVVILVAPGRHEHVAALVLNHSEGARIVVRGAGNEANPTVLAFGDTDGVLVDGGSPLTIENLVFVSRDGNKGIGLHLARSRLVTVIGCRFTGFRFGAFVDGGSHLTARECTFITKGDFDCVTIRNNSNGIIIKCTVKATGNSRSHGGFKAYNGGSLYCAECTAEGCYSGFTAHTSSSMHLENCTGGNNSHGASAWHSSSMNVIDSTFTNNAESGIAAFHSTAQIGGCRLNDSPIGVIVFGPALVGIDGKPTTIANSRIGIQATAGGRVWLREKPRYERVGTEIEEIRPTETVIQPGQ